MNKTTLIPNISRDGFEFHRNLFEKDKIEELKCEADCIAKTANSACVRNIEKLSQPLAHLAKSECLTGLIPNGYQPVRSILFDKTPAANWPVAWHQDLTISVKSKKDIPGYGPWSIKENTQHVQPPVELLENMVTLRIHLDKTNATNGALIVIPGTHQKARIPSDDIPSIISKAPYICECDPGDVLLMSPLILHSSQRSLAPNRRRILHFEYANVDLLHPELAWSH